MLRFQTAWFSAVAAALLLFGAVSCGQGGTLQPSPAGELSDARTIAGGKGKGGERKRSAKPVAVASATPVSAQVNKPVTFSDGGSTDPDGQIVKWEWNFGDGQKRKRGWQDFTSTQGLASHSYGTPGSYCVHLRVTDNKGNKDTGKVVVTITAKGATNENPVAVANADVTSGHGPTTVNFTATGSSDSDGTLVMWEWDFGTGFADFTSTMGATSQLLEAGSHTAILRVTDDMGAQATASVEIAINDLPGATIIATPNSGTAPLPVAIDASGSGDGDGTVDLYEFDFEGDGTYDVSGTSATASHTYGAGTFNLTVRITDNDGATATASTLVEVNGAPVAMVSATPSSGNSPLLVAIDASGSTDDDGTIDLYEYDFDGNGIFDETSTSPTTSHTYTCGIYQLLVRVTDNSGATSAATATIEVNELPTAAVTATPSSGNAPLTVAIDASGSFDSDGSLVQYEYDFDGNGSFDETSASATTSHVYTAPGSFNLTVRVTDNGGATATASTAVVVTLVVADFWHTWGGAGNEQSQDMLVASDGSIYLCGATGLGQALLTKHGPAGNFVWAKTWANALTSSTFEGLAQCPDGSICAVGYARYDGLDLQGLVVNFDANGSMQWQRHWGGAGSDMFEKAAVSSTGDIYVVGGAILSGSWQQCLVRFDTAGNQVWQRTWGGTLEDRALDVDLSPSGDICVAGFVGGFPAGNPTAFMFSNSGTQLWSRQVGTAGEERLSSVSVHPTTGEVFLTGATDGLGAGNQDVFIIRLMANGSVGNFVTYGTAGMEGVDGDSAIGPDGRLYVAFGSQVGGALVGFNSNFSLFSQRAWNQFNNNNVLSLGFDSSGGVLMGGNQTSALPGSWFAISGTRTIQFAFSGGTPSVSTQTMHSFAQDAGGTAGTATGFVDTGGGSRDFAVLRRTL